MAKIELVDLYPNRLTVHPLPGQQPVELTPSGPSSSFIVFHQTGLKEAAVHPFIRLVPILGQAMAGSQLPLDKVEEVARVTAAVCDMIENGATAEKVLGLLSGVAPGNQGLQTGAQVALGVERALADGRITGEEVASVLLNAGLGDRVLELFR